MKNTFMTDENQAYIRRSTWFPKHLVFSDSYKQTFKQNANQDKTVKFVFWKIGFSLWRLTKMFWCRQPPSSGKPEKDSISSWTLPYPDHLTTHKSHTKWCNQLHPAVSNHLLNCAASLHLCEEIWIFQRRALKAAKSSELYWISSAKTHLM